MGRRIADTAFVDRIDELRRLVAALDEAAGGDPSLMLVGGDAGVGKTRLLAEFVGTAASGGCRIRIDGAGSRSGRDAQW